MQYIILNLHAKIIKIFASILVSVSVTNAGFQHSDSKAWQLRGRTRQK